MNLLFQIPSSSLVQATLCSFGFNLAVCRLDDGTTVKAFLPQASNRVSPPSQPYQVLLQPLSKPGKTCTHRLLLAQIGVWQSVLPSSFPSTLLTQWTYVTSIYHNKLFQSVLAHNHWVTPFTAYRSQVTCNKLRLDFKLEPANHYIQVKASWMVELGMSSPRLHRHLSFLNQRSSSLVFLDIHRHGSTDLAIANFQPNFYSSSLKQSYPSVHFYHLLIVWTFDQRGLNFRYHSIKKL